MQIQDPANSRLYNNWYDIIDNIVLDQPIHRTHLPGQAYLYCDSSSHPNAHRLQPRNHTPTPNPEPRPAYSL